MPEGFVGARLIFEKVKREAEAESGEQHFLSFPPFTMDPKKGLFITVERRRGNQQWKEDIWLCAPFEIIGRVRDPQSHGWARLLRWKDDDKVLHQHSVADHDLHGEGAALCASLANAGLKIVTGGIRQYFVGYLNSAIVKARVTIVPRTGWHSVNDTRIFALPGEGIGIDGRVILAAEVTASHYASSGALANWQDSVAKLAAAHSRARFAIAAAFVSPLLALIGVDGGGINLQGPSSIGKTTLLSAAASVWGRGDERGFIRTWRGTGNGIEAAATQFSDTFLTLDEIGVASGHEVGNVVYSIAGGIGKQRANRDGSAKLPSTWRIFVLSTGEISISDKIREGGKRVRAGQEIRILDLSADAGKGFGAFDTGKNPEQLARDLRQAAITSYGTAGPAFIRAIIPQVNDVTIIAQESLDAFREQVAANIQSGQVLRAANRIGLVSVAGELAIQLGILPWPTGSVNEAAADVFRAWHVARGGNDPAEIRAAIDQIRGILERYGDSRFDPPHLAADSRPVPDRLGYIQGEGAGRQWWVLPRTWRNTFCEGFDAKDVAKALVERGLLLPGYGNETNRPVRINSQLTRAYVLPVAAWIGGGSNMSDDLRARMRAVFRPKDSSVKLSGSAKAPYGRYNVGSAKENAVTDGSGRYGVLSKEINAVTLVGPFSTNNKASQRENTLCSVCGAGGDLWTLGPVTVHEECASRLPKPGLAEPSAAYQATSAEPDGTACRVTIIEIPAKGLRFRRTFAHLQLRPPAYIPEDRWRQCVEDGKRFLAKWGEQAQALGWSGADLFGLHEIPAKPHPSYRRLSRYDATGLVWLLQGRPVVALTADTAAIENPTGAITTYRRFNKPSYGPMRDSLEDLE